MKLFLIHYEASQGESDYFGVVSHREYHTFPTEAEALGFIKGYLDEYERVGIEPASTWVYNYYDNLPDYRLNGITAVTA